MWRRGDSGEEVGDAGAVAHGGILQEVERIARNRSISEPYSQMETQ